jgi:hypothetical protein
MRKRPEHQLAWLEHLRLAQQEPACPALAQPRGMPDEAGAACFSAARERAWPSWILNEAGAACPCRPRKGRGPGERRRSWVSLPWPSPAGREAGLMSCGAGIQAQPGKRRRWPSRHLQQAGPAGTETDGCCPSRVSGRRPRPGLA